MNDGHNDGPIREGGREMVDDAGKVYEIRGNRVEDEVPDPRDTIGVEPAAGYMGGGAGGIATSGFTTAAGSGDSELRETSDSGIHGSVAEAADLGQRPLRDYKRDVEPAGELTMSGDQSGSGGSSSSVSSMDAVESRPVVGRATGDMSGHGTTILDTSQDRFDQGSSTVRDVSGGEVHRTVETTVASQPVASTPVSAGETDQGSLSLDTDNTSPIGDVSSTETLDNVQVGYRVIDGNGDEIGTVRDLKAGDTSATTVDEATDSSNDTGVFAIPGGTSTGGSGGFGSGGGIPAVVGFGADSDGGEPNVSEPAYTRLSRTGFIKVDSKGWFSADRYAGADQIDRVEGETVYLRVGKDQLISAR